MSFTLGLLLFAQAAAGGTLRVTVVDQTQAVVVGATVTFAGAEPVKTSEAGVAIVSALKPGVYTVEVEFPGFEKRVLNDVRVRSGRTGRSRFSRFRRWRRRSPSSRTGSRRHRIGTGRPSGPS